MQHEQSIEFVISIRKELVKIGISIEKKQEQYGQSEENSSLGGNIANNGHKFVLNTVSESIKRALESVNKRIDSFVYYSSGSLKRDQSTLDHHH